MFNGKNGLKKITAIVSVASLLLINACREVGATEPYVGKTKMTSPHSRTTGRPCDRLIVQLKRDADQDKFSDLLQEVHGTVIKTLEFGPDVSFLIVQTEPGTMESVEKQLHLYKDVQFVERNFVCQTADLANPSHAFVGTPRLGHFFFRSKLILPHFRGGLLKGITPSPTVSPTPKDPLFPVEWDLTMLNWAAARTSQVGQATASSTVPMYFVDTGVDYQPPEIGTSAIQFNCFDPPNSIGVQEYLYDSGTHGSGTTAVTAATDNGIALAGAANFEGNRIQLIMCRITNGGIDTATVEGVLTALNFIYLTSWFTPGPVNVSVGSSPPNTLNSLASIQTAAQKLQQRGFIVVMAAGNNGAYDSSPELYVRRVLALSQNAMRASWSNYGPFQAAAPGDQVSIYIPGGIAEYFGSGTSFAAPRWCAAIAAVMAALPPNKRIATFADAIVSFTASTTPEGYKVPNFQAAIQMAASQ